MTLKEELKKEQEKVWDLSQGEAEFVLMPVKLVVDGEVKCNISTNRKGGVIVTNSLLPDRLFYYASIEEYIKEIEGVKVEFSKAS